MRALRLAFRHAAAAILIAAAAVACARINEPPRITLVTPGSTGIAYVEIGGLSNAELRALSGAGRSASDWQRILTVSVHTAREPAGGVAIAGRYAVSGATLRFTPLFPFDPGRQYDVSFDRAAIPGNGAGSRVTATVALPAAAATPATFVTGIYPSGDTLRENQLRMYIHFSAPMGRRGGVEYVKLLDEAGREVREPFLPLEAEFWNADRTRYTVFFDPGRQKRGILPNREMGPSLVAGREYSLIVDRAWPDGHGQPLRETFTRRFRVGPPALSAIEPRQWKIAAPAGGSRDAIVVEFPGPLDHALLQRAIGVRRSGAAVVGEVRVENHEQRWLMTPAEQWQPGAYELIALPILEDAAGNRIGRPFEVAGFQRPADPRPPTPDSRLSTPDTRPPTPETPTVIPFTIAPTR